MCCYLAGNLSTRGLSLFNGLGRVKKEKELIEVLNRDASPSSQELMRCPLRVQVESL